MPKKILVVDNHPVMLKFMSGLLEKEGHTVVTAEDGLSALGELKQFSPDLIFVDLVMPNISGNKLCQILRSMPQVKKSMIVIISGIAAEENIDFIELGADACIAKGPFDKMAIHVLNMVECLEQGDTAKYSDKILGLEDVYSRAITKELLSSKRHSDVILNNISEGILEVSLDGKIIYANPVAQQLTGVREERLLGSDLMALFDPTERNRIESLIAFIDEGPQEIPASSPIMIKGRQVTLNMVSVQDKGHKTIIVILRDISDQIQMEAQLQRAQKMEAIGTLAGGVAHDLNNILAGLVGYPELLLMELPEGSYIRKSILTIKRSGEKAAAIVQDLLTLARRGVAVKEIVNLNEIITEYLKSPEYEKLKLYHQDMRIDLNLDHGLANISGSPVHLAKAIMNLISNAAEAMLTGGTICITTQNRWVEHTQKGYENIGCGEYAVVEISDTGVGISREEIEKIFEPFYTKKVMGRSGTGLGMAVVWGTVKDHNGYIDIRSKEQKGASFTLYFPITKHKPEKKQTYAPLTQYAGKGQRILVVDDVEEQRDIASQMLGKLGYHIDTVPCGEAAVEQLKKETYDLVILDMIMAPGMDGLETYKNILKIRPGQKAVIASGFSETDRVREAQRLGAGEYIKKPYLIENIGRAVMNALK